MTTTIKVHVNGRYRATVVQTMAAYGGEPVTTVIEGNYDGSPNPGGEHSFHLSHPAAATFEITEEPVPEEIPAVDEPKALGDSVPGDGDYGKSAPADDLPF